MATSYATATDETRIAYEAVGEGPPLMLLHGGSQSRRVWFEHGYVDALKDRFRLICVDARGHGESGKPTRRSDYAIETVMADMLAVADACGAERLDVLGYSYGGNIGRYLASRTDRISRFILLGIGFGPGAPDSLRGRVEATLAPWAPVLAHPPRPQDLPQDLQAQWRSGAVAPVLAWFGALLDWPAVEPRDLHVPTLWLVGSKNEHGALDSLATYGPSLPPHVRAEVLEGLDHFAELTRSDLVLPHLLAFLTAAPPSWR
jgi:pimeloyl-ACP methyl ester carboxylesterase